MLNTIKKIFFCTLFAFSIGLTSCPIYAVSASSCGTFDVNCASSHCGSDLTCWFAFFTNAVTTPFVDVYYEFDHLFFYDAPMWGQANDFIQTSTSNYTQRIKDKTDDLRPTATLGSVDFKIKVSQLQQSLQAQVPGGDLTPFLTTSIASPLSTENAQCVITADPKNPKESIATLKGYSYQGTIISTDLADQIRNLITYSSLTPVDCTLSSTSGAQTMDTVDATKDCVTDMNNLYNAIQKQVKTQIDNEHTCFLSVSATNSGIKTTVPFSRADAKKTSTVYKALVPLQLSQTGKGMSNATVAVNTPLESAQQNINSISNDANVIGNAVGSASSSIGSMMSNSQTAMQGSKKSAQ